MISASPSIVTKVPLLLWSFSTHLSCPRSSVQCRRDARWSATVTPQPDAQPELARADRRQRVDGAEHRGGRGHRRVRAREERHHLVAHGLHHPPARRLHRLAHQLQAARDRAVRRRVAGHLVKLGAAADVGEKNRALTRVFHPLPDCRSKMGSDPDSSWFSFGGSDPDFLSRANTITTSTGRPENRALTPIL